MDIDSSTGHPAGPDKASISTRRSFIVAASLGAVSLYGLWAGLGAAPLRFWEDGGSDHAEPDAEGGGHGDHGGRPAENADAFRQAVDKFVTAHQQPDGSVQVGLAPAGLTMSDGLDGSGHGDHAATGSGMADHDMAMMPSKVYLLAQQWSFEPSWLRLAAGTPYRLKLMAADAAHGASLQLGPGSAIIRLPKGVLVERTITFTRPGTHLLYCTVYCGEGHHAMSGKLEIV